MHRKFIAFILGTAIAVASASTAAPARADDDLVKALAGFAALAIIGKAISDARDRPDPYVAPVPSYKRPIQGTTPRHITRQHSTARPLPRNVSRYDLPQRCLHAYTVPGRKNVNLYGAGCLRAHYSGFNRLPSQCRAEFRANGIRKATYKPGCLHRYGYRLARR